jgi:hypothetical protein
MRVLVRGRVRWAALIAIVGALAVGGVAYAVIPDSTGVVHTCYAKSGGTLRVIDNSVANCKSNETALPISQTGLPGADGADGVSGYEVVVSQGQEVLPFSTNVIIKTAVCPDGKVPVGGGGIAAAITGSSVDGGITNIQSLGPNSAGDGWSTGFGQRDGIWSIDDEINWTVRAVCVTALP